jgi:hypothetical protein
VLKLESIEVKLALLKANTASKRPLALVGFRVPAECVELFVPPGSFKTISGGVIVPVPLKAATDIVGKVPLAPAQENV